MKKIIFLFTVLLITINGCRKDIQTKDEIFIPIGDDVITNLHGRVIDVSGRSIPEAEIVVEDETTFTNQDGYFYIPNISVPSDGFVIDVKSQNNKISRRTTPISETNTYEEIVLLSQQEFNVFSTDSESIISDGLTSVTISPNSLIDGNDNLYQGEFFARLTHYNPSSTEVLRSMPGNLQGIDKNGDKVTLGSFGMIDIEVVDPNGESLHLAPDNFASAKMNIPGFLSENIEVTIPTWRLDAISGLWLESGEVTDRSISGDIGFIFFDIDRFNRWNCDIKELNTDLSGTLLDEAGLPIENRLIRFNFFSEGQEFFCSGGYTNSLGQFNTLVPKNIPLTLNIYDKNCEDIIYTEEVGPFENDNNIIKLENQISKETYTISGVAFDCNENKIYDNATVFLYNKNGDVQGSTQTSADGVFTIHNICYDTNFNEGYFVGILDLDTGIFLLKDSLIFSEIDDNIGNIIPCFDIIEVINVQSNFGELSFDNSDTSYDFDSLVINSGPIDNGVSFSLFANVSEEGNNTINYLQVEYVDNQVLTCTSLYQHTICSNAVSITITEINTQLKIIAGNIQGILYYGDLSEPDSTISTDVSINFRVKY